MPVYQVKVDTALELPRGESAEDMLRDSPALAPTPVLPLHVITANVQSLKDTACNPFNPSGHAARRQYFYDQLHRQDVDIVCLQETRSKAGRWATAGVLTWRSGAHKGQYGCEVWIRPEVVRPALTLLDFRIVVSQPRLLLVTSINPRFPISVCAAHAPHSDRPDSEAETFWHELREALNRAPTSRGLVVGLDANGDFTSADFAGCLIGSHLADSDPTRNDMCLLDLCLQHGLEAPATFPNVQVGPRWSWEHSGGRQKRLDHLLFRPGPWAHHLASQALDFDLATADRDHVALRVRTVLHAPRKVSPQSRPRRCTASEIASHGDKLWASVRTGAVAEEVCCPGRQVAHFLRCFTTWRRGLPPRPPVVPCQPYISDRTRGVLETLRDWRAQLRHVKQQAKDILCLRWFRRWARRGDLPHASTHVHCLRLHIAAIERQVHHIGRTAHTFAREDKLAHFSSLTERASAQWHRHGRPLEAITHLKWASRRSAERRAVHAAGGYQIDDALEEQFRAQEGAQRVSHTQLSNIAQEWWQRPTPPCPAAIPSLLQVEAAARSQAGGKAPGPDQVPNEIWSRHPVHTGQWLWPLCLRIGLSGREPFHFKRAIVCALYKKGPASLPENYRSIALLNGIAKLWHGHLRRSIGGSILGRYDPLQLGGRSGVPVSFAVAACRAASDLCNVQGRCEATLYVDIQAAYYEASRALLFHGDSQLSTPADQHLQHLAGLTQLLVTEGALQILGVAPEEIALLQDCVSASHWSLSGSTNTYLATRGSRPGDGLADIALFAIGLRHIRRVCSDEGWAHHCSGALVGRLDEVLPLGWADDLAIMSDFESPTALQQCFPRVAVVALSTLRHLRFRVNLGPGKTEAMLHIRGARAKEVRGVMLGHDPCLPLPTGDVLRLTPEYRYLGVVLTPKDTGRRDAELCSQRAQTAWAHARGLIASPSPGHLNKRGSRGVFCRLHMPPLLLALLCRIVRPPHFRDSLSVPPGIYSRLGSLGILSPGLSS